MGKIDYNLLYLTSENSRLSLKEISKILKKSPQRLKYSISTLQKEDILKEPFCIFEYSYFRLILFRVYFRNAYISEKDRSKIIKELRDNPFILSIYELEGEFDLAIEFASPNPSKFNKELKKLVTSIPTLKDYKIILNLVTYLTPRDYLTKNLDKKYPETLFGGDREPETLSNNELKIIKSLLKNPNMRLTDLAKETDLNIKTAKTTLNQLMKKNIIKGFKRIINTNKLDIHKVRILLKLHNLDLEKEAEFTKFLLKNTEIVQINKTVGDWDMELDIESMNKTKIRKIITEIRENYKEILETFNMIDFYTYYKRSYLPKYLFEENQ